MRPVCLADIDHRLSKTSFRSGAPERDRPVSEFCQIWHRDGGGSAPSGAHWQHLALTIDRLKLECALQLCTEVFRWPNSAERISGRQLNI